MRNVTFLATKKAYQEAPIFTQVHFEERTQRFYVNGREYEAIEVQESGKTVDYKLGNQILKEDGVEKKGPKVPLNILASDTFTLRHGFAFDLDDAGDAFMVDLWLDSEHVAKSKRELNPSEHHFMLNDPHQDAKLLIDNSRVKKDVYNRVVKMSAKDFRDFAFADKKSVLVDEMTPEMLEAYVYAEVDKDAARVLKLLEGKDFKAKAFLGRLTQHKLVHINGPQYRIGSFNGEVMGIDEPSAISFLTSPANALIVRNWRDELKRLDEEVALEEEAKQVASK